MAALMLYAPLQTGAFEMVDFGEFVPLLRAGGSFGDSLANMVAYYATHGRFNPVTFAATAAKWELFGAAVLPWTVTHVAVMLAVVASVILLLRRVGASTAGALAGAALFVVARPAADAWMKIHVGEPIGTLLVAIAALVGLGLADRCRWLARASVVGALLAAAVLAKETLIACLPFVLALATLGGDDERRSLAKFDRRTLGIVAVVAGIVFVLAAVPILVVRASASPGAYASSYALSSVSTSTIAAATATVALPGTESLLTPANLAFLALIGAGWWLALKSNAPARRTDVARLLAGGAMIVAGTVVYVPWPDMQAFYALPFLLGSALLLAIAMTRIQEHARGAGRAASWIALAIVLVFTAKWAHWRARSASATRQLNAALLEELDRHRDAVGVIVAVRAENRWRGDLIERYAEAFAGGAPPVREQRCGDVAPAAASAAGALVIVYEVECPMLMSRRSPRPLRFDYAYLDGRLRPAAGSVRVDVWTPAPLGPHPVLPQP